MKTTGEQFAEDFVKSFAIVLGLFAVVIGSFVGMFFLMAVVRGVP